MNLTKLSVNINAVLDGSGGTGAMKHDWNTEGTHTFCDRCSIFADDAEKNEPCSGNPRYPVMKRLIADGEMEDPRELWKELNQGNDNVLPRDNGE